MKLHHSLLAIAALFVALPQVTHAAPDTTKTTTVKTTSNSAVIPAHKLKVKWWKQRHETKLAAANKTSCDLLFVGDSITHSWEKAGHKTWQKHYANRKAFNIGFSGDKTQHVLWRLDNGEMAKFEPKVAVLMIGTNNTGHNLQKAEETAAGIQAIINKIHQLSPKTQVLLLSIFPRSAQPDQAKRKLNDKINAIIKTYHDGQKVTYLDLSPAFLEKDGSLSRKIMPDLLHPNGLGYEIWAEAMEPTLKTMLGKK